MLTKRKKNFKKSMIALSLIVALALNGCASSSTELKPHRQIVVPALSQSAQMPQPINECLPSCLEYLTNWREDTLRKLESIN